MNTTSVTSEIVNNIVVGNNSALVVGNSGIAIATTVTSGGTEIASSGGTTIGTVLGNGGKENVLFGGTAAGTTVSSGGHEYVASGGKSFETAVAVGGRVTVQSGGLAVGTTVAASGHEVVSSGGESIGTVLADGGKQGVRAGGIAISVTVGSGAKETVFAGGVVSNATVMTGGAETVSSGGMVFNTTVKGPGDGSAVSGGTLVVDSGAVANNTTLDGGVLILRGGTATGSIDFAGGGSVLEIASGSLPTATLKGFGAGDVIDLVGVHHTTGGSVTLDSGTPGQLTIVEDGTTFTLQLDPSQDYTGDTFSLTTDGKGGTDVAVTCFAPGTSIATPDGTAAVETLRAGDRVLLADGTAATVRWLGVQTIATRFADPVRAFPIRVRAGALGEGLPSRDLVVSPGHALLIDGLLVQAGALVNGDSIQRVADVPEMLRYYHVELDAHALLLAEGVAAESYLEAAEPMPFDNAHERVLGAAVMELPYPRVKAHRQVPPALSARLGALAARASSLAA